MKRKPLIIALLSVVMIVSMAYSEYYFTHTVDNGETKATESVFMESERQYYVYVHGVGTEGVLELRVKDAQGNNVFFAPTVYFENVALFTVPSTGYYTCITKNITTGENQRLHADWCDTN